MNKFENNQNVQSLKKKISGFFSAYSKARKAVNIALISNSPRALEKNI